METGSAVARTSSRAARPCAADAAPPKYPDVREDLGLGAQEGRHYSPADIVGRIVADEVLFMVL